jgi:photosystem II stability/assembly factor-like uncharacterized protein
MVFSRKRLVPAAYVAAFVAAFAGIGAVARSTPEVPAIPLPFLTWYWSLTVSPSDPNVLLLGTSDGLYRSEDGGKTWRQTGGKGVVLTSLARSGNTIFAGGVPAPTGVSPGWIRKGAVRVAPDGATVLEASTDDGQTWQELHPHGLPNVSVQALAVDPKNSASLYALLNTGRLYRSNDGARSFRLVSATLGVPPWAFAIMPNHHFLAGDMDSGSYVSTSGKAWRPAPFTDALGGKMVMEYAVQPTDSARVLMTSRGVEMSTDGGRTWHRTLKSDVMFGPVAWVPTKPNVAYVLGFDRSLWRTLDGGKSWAKIA